MVIVGTASHQIETPYQAMAHGWHRGIQYQSMFNVFSEFPYDSFRAWCEATFPSSTYVIFTTSAWFLNEQDAVLCQLRWA